ncbi:MAG: phosphoribosylformylglycinamidine cyclo-ligase [Candidatus Omnitrophica bacterium]|nr:phosphoribosylformylglycinamidine cyclo-ligase [Candidatus Omnitrophota bacterium]
MSKTSLTYKKAGVDIAKANRFVDAIKVMSKSTVNKQVLNRPGSFGALFDLGAFKYKNPVLVSSTDGVGTKLLVANLAGKHDKVGIDLVAMNVNDVLCTGAKPLFFLDYIATGKLNNATMKNVMKGIVEGCRLANCALIGGETAEMPDMYKGEDYDLAGFTVGIVEKSKLLDGTTIKVDDVVIGLPSSGLHSNGYSLARKALGETLQKEYAQILLKPTCIYVKHVLPVLEKFSIKGMAHMTGGAWYEKLTKILPKGHAFSIEKGSWPIPRIFQLIKDKGNIPEHDMYRTFNMGIGFVMVVSPKDVVGVQTMLRRLGQESFVIGTVVQDSKRKIIFN